MAWKAGQQVLRAAWAAAFQNSSRHPMGRVGGHGPGEAPDGPEDARADSLARGTKTLAVRSKREAGGREPLTIS